MLQRLSLAFVLLTSACAQNPKNEVFTAPPPGRPRFADPSTIVPVRTIDFSGPLVRAFPKYPRGLGGSGIADAIVDAYVIDTTGRVEIETASFLQTARPEFQRAVCESLTKIRYAPLMVGGVKRRALLIQTHIFVGSGRGDHDGEQAAAALLLKAEEEFANTPIANTVRKLDGLPHCDAFNS